jgi:hypothetical protein
LLNFVNKDAMQPILKGFHTTHDGHLEATNGHIMLRLLNRMPSNQECTIEPKELQTIEGDYPNVDRIIPTKHNAFWKLDPSEAPAIAKFLKSFAKNSDVLVTAKDHQLVIADVIGDTRSTFGLLDQSGDEIEFRCSASYLVYMMGFIADYAMFPVEVRLLSPEAAIVFELENHFIGLIMPKKTY